VRACVDDDGAARKSDVDLNFAGIWTNRDKSQCHGSVISGAERFGAGQVQNLVSANALAELPMTIATANNANRIKVLKLLDFMLSTPSEDSFSRACKGNLNTLGLSNPVGMPRHIVSIACVK
jgi:hypothetical protein